MNERLEQKDGIAAASEVGQPPNKTQAGRRTRDIVATSRQIPRHPPHQRFSTPRSNKVTRVLQATSAASSVNFPPEQLRETPNWTSDTERRAPHSSDVFERNLQTLEIRQRWLLRRRQEVPKQRRDIRTDYCCKNSRNATSWVKRKGQKCHISFLLTRAASTIE